MNPDILIFMINVCFKKAYIKPYPKMVKMLNIKYFDYIKHLLTSMY